MGLCRFDPKLASSWTSGVTRPVILPFPAMLVSLALMLFARSRDLGRAFHA